MQGGIVVTEASSNDLYYVYLVRVMLDSTQKAYRMEHVGGSIVVKRNLSCMQNSGCSRIDDVTSRP